jgi:hypothetical protein
MNAPPKRRKKPSGGDTAGQALPPWDKAVAAALPGNRLLVGITYLAEDGSLIEQQQLFGIVERADEREGILLELRGQRAGEQFKLPPDTRSIQEALPGTYQLRSTGEEVVDPDFTATFTVHKRQK